MGKPPILQLCLWISRDSLHRRRRCRGTGDSGRDAGGHRGRFIQEEQLPLVGLVNCAGLSRRLPLELEPMEAVKELYEVTLGDAVG